VDAAGTATREPPTPRLYWVEGEGPTGALEEEEAIDYGEEQRKKEFFFSAIQRTGRRGRLGERVFSFPEIPFFPLLETQVGL
jgi:hypothetical protein